jgi:hypothetical protein
LPVCAIDDWRDADSIDDGISSVLAGGARSGKGIESTAVLVDGQTKSIVEVLSVRTGSVGDAGVVDQDVPLHAGSTLFGDLVHAKAGIARLLAVGCILVERSDAGLEVAVVIWELRLVGTGVGVGGESKPDIVDVGFWVFYFEEVVAFGECDVHFRGEGQQFIRSIVSEIEGVSGWKHEVCPSDIGRHSIFDFGYWKQSKKIGRSSWIESEGGGLGPINVN